MAHRTQLHREYLGRNNKSRAAGTKIGAEEGEGIERYEGCMVFFFPMVIWNRCGDYHHEESHEMNGKTPYAIYGEGHEPTARNSREEGDQRLCLCNFVNSIYGNFTARDQSHKPPDYSKNVETKG